MYPISTSRQRASTVPRNHGFGHNHWSLQSNKPQSSDSFYRRFLTCLIILLSIYQFIKLQETKFFSGIVSKPSQRSRSHLIFIKLETNTIQAETSLPEILSNTLLNASGSPTSTCPLVDGVVGTGRVWYESLSFPEATSSRARRGTRSGSSWGQEHPTTFSNWRN